MCEAIEDLTVTSPASRLVFVFVGVWDQLLGIPTQMHASVYVETVSDGHKLLGSINRSMPV